MNVTATLCQTRSPAFFTFLWLHGFIECEKKNRQLRLTECRRYIHLSLAPKIRDKELPKLRTVLNSSNLEFLCTLNAISIMPRMSLILFPTIQLPQFDWIYIHVETCAKIWQLRRTTRCTFRLHVRRDKGFAIFCLLRFFFSHPILASACSFAVLIKLD